MDKQIISVAVYNGDFRTIAPTIGAASGLFDVVRLNKGGDTLYIDDEGLFVQDQAFFGWRGFDQPLAGRGLILGTDAEGDTASVIMTLDDVRKNVLWPFSFKLDGEVNTVWVSAHQYRQFMAA